MVSPIHLKVLNRLDCCSNCKSEVQVVYYQPGPGRVRKGALCHTGTCTPAPCAIHAKHCKPTNTPPKKYPTPTPRNPRNCQRPATACARFSLRIFPCFKQRGLFRRHHHIPSRLYTLPQSLAAQLDPRQVQARLAARFARAHSQVGPSSWPSSNRATVVGYAQPHRACRQSLQLASPSQLSEHTVRRRGTTCPIRKEEANNFSRMWPHRGQNYAAGRTFTSTQAWQNELHQSKDLPRCRHLP